MGDFIDRALKITALMTKVGAIDAGINCYGDMIIIHIHTHMHTHAHTKPRAFTVMHTPTWWFSHFFTKRISYAIAVNQFFSH